MIQVRTWDMPDGGVGFELSGHAVQKAVSEEGDDAEHTQVCAGSSMLLVTLAAMTNGQWGGQSSGSVICLVPASMLIHAEFTLVGLMLLAEAYKGHITIDQSSSRLGAEWKRVDGWVDQHRDESERKNPAT